MQYLKQTILQKYHLVLPLDATPAHLTHTPAFRFLLSACPFPFPHPLPLYPRASIFVILAHPPPFKFIITSPSLHPPPHLYVLPIPIPIYSTPLLHYIPLHQCTIYLHPSLHLPSNLYHLTSTITSTSTSTSNTPTETLKLTANKQNIHRYKYIPIYPNPLNTLSNPAQLIPSI